MQVERPFCHCFSTKTVDYAYDVGTNHIVAIEDKALWNFLRAACTRKGGRHRQQLVEADDHVVSTLEGAKSDGLFFPALRDCEPYKFTVDDVRRSFADGIPHMILSLTSGCNLRCSYCIQSERYQPNSGYSGPSMTWQTARQALDFYVANGGDDPRIGEGAKRAVGFYGGEPLLEFRLVERCVDYLESKHPGSHQYSITTNGTLLTEAVRDFLVEHRFQLVVSVDGPRQIHDAGRRSADGDPTFDQVCSNLRALRREHPEYYAERVSWSMVATWPNLDQTADFLEECDIAPSLIHVTSVRLPRETGDGPSEKTWSSLADWTRRLQRIAAYKQVGELTISEYLRSGYWLFRQDLNGLYNRAMARPGSAREWLHAGPCIPGRYRILVAPDGTMYPCVDIPCEPRYAIGSVGNGVDHGVVADMLNDFHALTARECSQCWATRICTICPALLGWRGEWSPEAARRACTRERRNAHRMLRLMCALLEVNPGFLPK